MFSAPRKRLRTQALIALALLVPAGIALALAFDQNATPAYFAGSGNLNGAFTVDRVNGVELALRAKLRFDGTCQPQNTFNSNGDGTYSFDPVDVDTYACPLPGYVDGQTPEWNFEWSINTDHDGSTGLDLADLTYQLSLDADPGLGVAALVADPINVAFADHAIGDNTTSNGVNEFSAVSPANYQALIGAYNVAQNSWSYEFFDQFPPLDGFVATLDGVYDISLTAFDGATAVASTTIQVIVGNPLLSAEQCKKGGWAAFGFKNQGQCIRYINTGKDSR